MSVGVGILHWVVGKGHSIQTVLTERRSVVREGAMHCWGREEQHVQSLLFGLFKEQYGR